MKKSVEPHGAEDGTRTHDLLITNQLLYHLSHFSERYYYIIISDKVKHFLTVPTAENKMDKDVNNRIRQYRNAASMSQEEMADRLGMKRSTYARREAKGTFDSDLLKKISEILKVPSMLLLYGEKNDAMFSYVTVHEKKKIPFEPTEDFVITAKERRLLTELRKLPVDEMNRILKMITDKLKP